MSENPAPRRLWTAARPPNLSSQVRLAQVGDHLSSSSSSAATAAAAAQPATAMSAPHVTVHWLEDSRAQRIVWLLQELGIDYEVKHYKRDPKTLLGPKELYDVHPLGKSPTVVVRNNGESVTLAESGAIVEFLIERYGADKLAVSPSSGSMQDRADYLYWLHYAEGSAMLPNMLAMVFGRLPAQAPWFLRPVLQSVSTGALDKMIVPRLKAQYGWIERNLEGKDYFVAGKLTGADIMMSFVAEILDASPVNKADFPNISRWHTAMVQRPAYKEALEKGGENNMGRFTQRE
ncbi:ER associated glutathione S-transferase [Rhodotorula taiwanensis]|uniref:glutathione transferase n=1 Tax=Rhodotorula taiwanensis TaxID=741276 RepID=A0A2S5B776_9BASI|nr:ER associated glutathione S-transferase [Rhodotorula taiwanensis]